MVLWCQVSHRYTVTHTHTLRSYLWLTAVMGGWCRSQLGLAVLHEA